MNPAEMYRTRLRERQQELKRLHKRDGQISTGRGLLFLGFIYLVWQITQNPDLQEALLAIPLGLFVLLVNLQLRLRSRIRRQDRAVRHYQEALDRLKGRWAEARGDGQRYRDANHPYANDLDLFGPGSVFQLVSRCQTRLGEDCLAKWLKEPAERDEVLARQAAIQELVPELDLREQLDVLHPPMTETRDQNLLASWVNEAEEPILPLTRGIVSVLTLIALVSIVWILLSGGLWTIPLSALAAQIVVLFLNREMLQTRFQAAEKAREGLSVAVAVLRLIEMQKPQSPKLIEIQDRLDVEGLPPSIQLNRLKRMVNLLSNCMRNQFLAPLAILFGLHIQVLVRIHRWKEHVGPGVERWLESIGEWESLLSLSGHAFEFPENCLPQIVEKGPVLETTAIQHPILMRDNCVPNDLSLTPEKKLLLVSGSNMSGKSTLLRTIGVNTVLAYTGSTVHAKSFRLSVLQVGAAMRVSDSLQEGKSLFYSVVTRLKEIVDLTEQPLPLLYLIDEILPGTNSHDRRQGAEGVLRSLVGRNTLGLVTTHDLALTQITDSLDGRAVNVHFEDDLKDGKMTFDYRLRPGVVQKSNALELMKMIGLDVGPRTDILPENHTP